MLSEESRAYGFTIGFWGSGTALIQALGMPSLVDVLLYGSGAVTGFGVLALISFGGATQRIDVEKDESEYLALASLHYIAALTPILLSAALARVLPGEMAFFVGGLSVSLLYNLLSLLEEDISEFLS